MAAVAIWQECPKFSHQGPDGEKEIWVTGNRLSVLIKVKRTGVHSEFYSKIVLNRTSCCVFRQRCLNKDIHITPLFYKAILEYMMLRNFFS